MMVVLSLSFLRLGEQQMRFTNPLGIAIDSSGNLYITAIIYQITSSGTVTTIAGGAGLRGSTDAWQIEATT